MTISDGGDRMIDARIDQAITTECHQRTGKYTARAYAGTVTIDALDAHSRARDEENHKAAALALCKKFDWLVVDLIGGRTSSGEVVWVCVYYSDAQEMAWEEATP